MRARIATASRVIFDRFMQPAVKAEAIRTASEAMAAGFERRELSPALRVELKEALINAGFEVNRVRTEYLGRLEAELDKEPKNPELAGRYYDYAHAHFSTDSSLMATVKDKSKARVVTVDEIYGHPMA